VNAVSKGSAAERLVVKDLEAKGFLVGSRRHIPGPGDLLAVRGDGLTWLIEVKCRKNPYEGFRKPDREAMKEILLPVGGARWLACVRGQRIDWIPESDWP